MKQIAEAVFDARARRSSVRTAATTRRSNRASRPRFGNRNGAFSDCLGLFALVVSRRALQSTMGSGARCLSAAAALSFAIHQQRRFRGSHGKRQCLAMSADAETTKSDLETMHWVGCMSWSRFAGKGDGAPRRSTRAECTHLERNRGSEIRT